MKHTSGPWKVMCGSVYTESGIPIAHMDRSPENGTTPTERDVNAHLIAAAPKMFEAIRLILDECALIAGQYHEICKQAIVDIGNY